MLHRQDRERVDDFSALWAVECPALGGRRREYGGHWISESPGPSSCARSTLGRPLPRTLCGDAAQELGCRLLRHPACLVSFYLPTFRLF
jgi:hypothetical protein